MECTGVASKSDLPIPPSPPKPEPVINRKRRAQEVVEPDESVKTRAEYLIGAFLLLPLLAIFVKKAAY